MAEPNGEDAGTWSGVWTIGSAAEEIPGVLNYVPPEGFELLLPGGAFRGMYERKGFGESKFTPGDEVGMIGLADSHFPAIWGVVEGHKVTLLDFELSRQRNYGFKYQTASYKGHLLAWGAHIRNKEELCICEASFSADYFHLLVEDGLRIEVSRGNCAEEKRYFTVEGEWDPKSTVLGEVQLNDSEASFNAVIDAPRLEQSRKEYFATATNSVALRHSFAPKTSIQRVLEISRDLSRILTLARGKNTDVYSVSCVLEGEGKTRQWVELIQSRNTVADVQSSGRLSAEFAFRLGVDEFLAAWSKWLKFSAEGSRLIGLLIELKTGQSFLESKILLSGVLAEAFHTQVFGSCLSETESKFETLFPQGQAYELRKDKTKRPTFKLRLLDLYMRLPKALRNHLLPEGLRQWLRYQTTMRNSVAHAAQIKDDEWQVAYDAHTLTVAVVEAHVWLKSEVSLSRLLKNSNEKVRSAAARMSRLKLSK